MPDFEVLDSWEFHYGPLDRSETLDVMDAEAMKAASKEAEKAREGALVFIRLFDYWHPVTGDAYEDVWSGKMLPLMGANITCYGVVRGEHTPRERRSTLDAMYEEWKRTRPPYTKGKLT